MGLNQIPALRPRKYATISKRQKTVRRAYGGSRCGVCVKSRYVICIVVFIKLLLIKRLLQHSEGILSGGGENREKGHQVTGEDHEEIDYMSSGAYAVASCLLWYHHVLYASLSTSMDASSMTLAEQLSKIL